MKFEDLEDLAKFCYNNLISKEDSSEIINYLIINKEQVIWTNGYFLIKWNQIFNDVKNGMHLIKVNKSKNIILKKQEKGKTYLSGSGKLSYPEIIKFFKDELKKLELNKLVNNEAIINSRYFSLILRAISKKEKDEITKTIFYPIRIKIPAIVERQPLLITGGHGIALLMQSKSSIF